MQNSLLSRIEKTVCHITVEMRNEICYEDQLNFGTKEHSLKVKFKFKEKSFDMKIFHINSKLITPKYIFYRMQTIQFNHNIHKRYWI